MHWNAQACVAWRATAPVGLRLQPVAGLPSHMLPACQLVQDHLTSSPCTYVRRVYVLYDMPNTRQRRPS